MPWGDTSRASYKADPKREPVVSNIVLIQSTKRELLVSNRVITNHPEKKKRLPSYAYAWLSTVIICAQKRARYKLGRPKLDVKDMSLISKF